MGIFLGIAGETMLHLPFWARAVALATVVATAAGTAWAQAPQLPGGIPGIGGALSGSAEAAAIAHYLQMLKHFDQNGNGVLDPNEMGQARSGLGNLLGPGGNVAGASNNTGNVLPIFDRNGNGQLDAAELQMAQMMMAMLMAGYSRPVTGVPLVMPDQPMFGQANPPSQPRKRGRRNRAQRFADFAKGNNVAPAPVAPVKKKVKARGPMVEQNRPQDAAANK
jgi:hypothetical protein